MTEMEKKFEEFEKEILDTEKKDYHFRYNNEAFHLISDIKYAQEHISRLRKSERFVLEIIPNLNYFIRKMFFKTHQSYWLERKKMIIFLKIFDITEKIINNIVHGKNGEYKGVNKKWIKKAIKWGKVLQNYTGIDIKKILDSFIYSSSACCDIKKAWAEVEKEGEKKEVKNTEREGYHYNIEIMSE